MAEPNRKAYRSNFLHTFQWTLLWSFGSVLGLMLSRGNFLIIFVLIPFILIFALAGTFFAVHFYPVYISSQGIRSYNAWGIYSSIAWPEITAIELFNFLGLRYLTVKGGRKKQVLIPLFLSEMDAFQNDIQAFTGDSSLLTQSLKRELNK